MTPLLPGGENGGAKIFVLELLRRISSLAPDARFILLTQAASHDELASLERDNVRRHLVLGQEAPQSLRGRLVAAVRRCLSYLPERVRSVVLCAVHVLRAMTRQKRNDSLLCSLGADLLFCPFTAPTYSGGGVPVVCTLYDLQFRAYPQFFSTLELAGRERSFREACRKANVIVCISESTREMAMAQEGLAPERLVTSLLRMARRVTPDRERSPGVLGALGLEEKRYLVYPANFWRHKNHEMLLVALGLCAARGLPADLKLVCTGASGERQKRLMAAAKAMGLGDRVLFPGFLSNEDIGIVIGCSLGMVYPSLYEGFGLPVAEAMAAGVPVACSNSTSLPEVAGGAALLFDPRVPESIAEAILALVADASLRERLIAAGLRQAEQFLDSDRMARDYLECFQLAATASKGGNSLDGVYSDGWAEPELVLHGVPGQGPQTAVLEMSFPAWLPVRKIHVSARRAGESFGPARKFTRGSSGRMELPLDERGGSYHISFSASCDLRHYTEGKDQRIVAAKVDRCEIRHGDGSFQIIFSAADQG